MDHFCSMLIALTFTILFTITAVICGTLLFYNPGPVFTTLTAGFSAGAAIFICLFVYSLYQELSSKETLGYSRGTKNINK